MRNSEQETNTFAYYNHHASDFLSHRGEGVSQYWSSELNIFQNLLPKGTVMEIGCGVGNEAILIKEKGYDYLGLDNSISMLSIAKSRSPELNFLCQDFRTINFPEKFDGIVAIASLLHLPKNELIPALTILNNHLRDGGIGFFTLKEGEGTEIDDKGRFYSYYSAPELTNYFTDSGFEVLHQTIHQEKGHSFLCFFVQKPKQ